MKHQMIRSAALTALAFALLAGCGSDAPPPSPTHAPTPVEPVAGPVSTLSVESKVGRPAPEILKADADTMLSLVSAKHEEVLPMEINSDGSLAIHPGHTASSWVEFNTTSLRSIDLYPAVRINASCRENPEAGIVGLTVYSDGKRLGERALLNREDRPQLRIALNGAKTIKLEVDQGNDRITCDWFSVGIRATAN